jgi:hypothetical protein
MILIETSGRILQTGIQPRPNGELAVMVMLQNKGHYRSFVCQTKNAHDAIHLLLRLAGADDWGRLTMENHILLCRHEGRASGLHSVGGILGIGSGKDRAKIWLLPDGTTEISEIGTEDASHENT